MTALELEQARAILTSQAFSRTLGTELIEFGEGRAVLALDIQSDHTQQNGFAHGGILAYLVDNAVVSASTRRRAIASCTITDGDRVVAVGQGTATLLEEDAAD